MDFSGLLEAENRFAAVASVRMAAGQQTGLGNPHAVFVLSELHFGEWNNHRGQILTWPAVVVKSPVTHL
jgi:hypothetical protein